MTVPRRGYTGLPDIRTLRNAGVPGAVSQPAPFGAGGAPKCWQPRTAGCAPQRGLVGTEGRPLRAGSLLPALSVHQELDQELHPQFNDAVTALDLDVNDSSAVLRARRGICTLKVGALVVKVFATSQSDYWHREATAYRALEGSDLAPQLAGVGDLWVATVWLDLITPASLPDSIAMHHALGEALARFHTVDGCGLQRLSMADRLHHWLNERQDCPPALARDVARAIVPLTSLYQESHFVHGDWGDANVLAPANDPYRISKIIDFEDSHLGDPAEDFKWTLVHGGPPWGGFETMAGAYTDAGGALGEKATERLVLAATEWCLDLLSWQDDFGTSQFREGALAALDAFVSLDWPSLA